MPSCRARLIAAVAAARPWAAACAALIRTENPAQDACGPTYVGRSAQPIRVTARTQDADRFGWAQADSGPPRYTAAAVNSGYQARITRSDGAAQLSNPCRT